MTEPIALRLTVAPANVAGNEARTEWTPTERGYVAHATLQFPSGCNGTIHVAVEDPTGRLLPVKGGDLALSGVVLPLPNLRIPIGGNSPAVRLVGWADAGNANSHTIDVILIVEPFQVV